MRAAVASTVPTTTDRYARRIDALLRFHFAAIALQTEIEQHVTMSKILEAARLVADRKKSYDDRAQAIIDGMPRLDTKANEAFEKPEGAMAAAERDFKDLHDIFDEANALSNSEKNDEGKKETAGSQGSSDNFQA